MLIVIHIVNKLIMKEVSFKLSSSTGINKKVTRESDLEQQYQLFLKQS